MFLVLEVSCPEPAAVGQGPLCSHPALLGHSLVCQWPRCVLQPNHQPWAPCPRPRPSHGHRHQMGESAPPVLGPLEQGRPRGSTLGEPRGQLAEGH